MPVMTSKVDPVPFQPWDLAFLEPGRTTRHSVVERLGEPTLSRKAGRMMVYAVAANTHRFLLLGGASPYTHYYLFIDLAGDGTVESFEVINSEEHGLEGVQGPTACRSSGICIVQEPWVFMAGPPWDPLGVEELPSGWDFAVLMDAIESDAEAKGHVPRSDECLVYFWGVPGGYTVTFLFSIDGSEWRSLLYETVLPASASRRTFMWRLLPHGHHVLRSAIFQSTRLDAIEEHPFECPPGETRFFELSEYGFRGSKTRFERLPEAEGHDRLRKSRVVLE